MTDSIVQNFDYDIAAIEEIDYKEQFMGFLARWCAMCQNREPMTRADVAANEFAIKVQAWLERMIDEQ